MIKDDPQSAEDKENGSLPKRKCKNKFRIGKTKLTNYLETLDELEKAIEKGRLNKKLCESLRKVCKAISKEKELVDRPIIKECSDGEDEMPRLKSCRKSEDDTTAYKKRRTHY
eukprot:TRINITY_DN18788_c0_g1_i1.p1 TRINITY_DN18788_c0_g1~~TRINITY_DN18788_c0_g1_i1.p1  ORF type:complete len:113 (-),score=41.57 TRINITY_DN18788_c0_g1_i1:136-474(-)